MKFYKARVMFVLIGALFLGVSFVCAETIILKSGLTFEGKIIEKTDEHIKVDFQGVPLTYYFDQIESIDGIKVEEKTEKNNSQILTEAKVESASTPAKQNHNYINNKFNFRFTIPDGWALIDEDNYSEYWRKLSERAQMEKGFKAVCFLVEQFNLGVLDGPSFMDETFPVAIVLARLKAVPENMKQYSLDRIVKIVYDDNKRKYSLVEKSSKGKIKIDFKEIKNVSKESILKITMSSSDKQDGKTGWVVMYRYVYVNQVKTEINDFFVSGMCYLDQSKEYGPVYDNFVKDFQVFE